MVSSVGVNATGSHVYPYVYETGIPVPPEGYVTVTCKGPGNVATRKFTYACVVDALKETVDRLGKLGPNDTTNSANRPEPVSFVREPSASQPLSGWMADSVGRKVD